MGSIFLHDGREITCDLYKITISEFRLLMDTKQSKVDEDATMAKAFGLKPEELSSLPFPDYLVIEKSFIETMNDALSGKTEKNSDGGSTNQ
jgi:hypothetical protein